ncbi:orotate phosphoribosyltransferase [Salibacterium halotolerans]|uniref:Orotate phosphoribosyltransferase n=1 Tax=Salibacterium halotolerans TaxID=1884432 RepID=A0A1I5M8I7_9BACI|nr:orotate phosphoribosyltransferase [Salibacterium halotolerans]SFP05637.1 orotate phosphoribosyltransferase [Salibacterium halotolerans]
MKQWLAEELLKIEAVSLSPNEPYTWTSGIKSPIYCDNRLTLSYPALRKAIARGLADMIRKKYPEADIVAGTATAGIAHAALAADMMELPMIYVRSSSKSHGKENRIEGEMQSGRKVVIVEDLISTGGSVVKVKDALLENGAEVLGTAAIFTYGLQKGEGQLHGAGMEWDTLTDYGTLIDTALHKNYLSQNEAERLHRWKQNPEDESWLQTDEASSS